jgi:hypothetical protein
LGMAVTAAAPDVSGRFHAQFEEGLRQVEGMSFREVLAWAVRRLISVTTVIRGTPR